MTRDERGLSESVQWAVLVPVLLLCLLGFIQGGVWLHARTGAQQAAAAGADAASVAGAAAGQAAARDVAAAADLTSVQVQVIDRGATWEVRVQARARVLFDLGQGAVRGAAVTAKESR